MYKSLSLHPLMDIWVLSTFGHCEQRFYERELESSFSVL